MTDIKANEILGNEAALTMMRHAVTGGRVHHAYLFYGQEGLGKKTFARYFAKALLCAKGTSCDKSPCGVCPACVKFSHGAHPDYTEMISDGGKNSIHIERIRALRADCVMKPNEGSRRIYFIPEIQNMTTGAFNAFLKTLEEPPAHAVFLLTAPGLDSLPATVVSRVMPVALYPLDNKTVLSALEKRHPDLPVDVRIAAAEISGGNLGKAIEKLMDDSDEGQVFRDAADFCDAVGSGQEYRMLLALSSYEKDKKKLLEVLEGALVILRSALRGGKSGQAVALGQNLGRKQLLDTVAVIEECRYKLQGNININLISAWLCASVKRVIG